MKSSLIAESSKSQSLLAAIGSFCRCCYKTFIFISALLLVIVPNVSAGQNKHVVDLSDPNIRWQIVEQLAERSRQRKADAVVLAHAYGWAPKKTYQRQGIRTDGNRRRQGIYVQDLQ